MENENVKNNSRKNIVLIIIGVLIVIIGLLGVMWKIRMSNPVTITTATLRGLAEGVDGKSNLGKLINFMEEADTLETSMTGEVKLPMDYGTVALDMLIQEDADDREAIMDLDVKLNGEDALYVEGQLDRNALYFAFKKNVEKYYYLTDLYYPEIEDIDIDELIDIFITSFGEVVTEKDFSETEKKITVNGEVLTAKQYSLNWTEKISARLLNKVLEKVLLEEDLIEDLAQLTDTTESELRKQIQENITSETALKDMSEEATLVYSLYVYKNKAVRYEFTHVDYEEESIYVDNYKYTEFVINGTDDYGDKAIITLKEENNNWSINVDSTDVKVKGSISEEKYDITITAEDTEIVINGTEEYMFARDNIELIEKGNIKITQDGASIEVPYEFKIKLKDIENVAKKNITNKVDINNMTPEEETEFNNVLSQIPIMSLFISNSNPEYNNADVNSGIYEDTYNYSDQYSYTEDYGYGYGY